jgi:hypothetical protein
MKRQHKPLAVAARRSIAPRQLALALGAPQLWAMQPQERQRVITRLAAILMEAAGVAPAEEDSDDRR